MYQEKRGVKAVYVHPGYRTHCDRYDDLALLLVEDFDITAYVKPICVGTVAPAADTDCLTSGWGKTGKI